MRDDFSSGDAVIYVHFGLRQGMRRLSLSYILLDKVMGLGTGSPGVLSAGRVGCDVCLFSLSRKIDTGTSGWNIVYCG